MENVLRSTRVTLEMIKWEHSIFALPFALTGAMLAANGWPPLRVLFWIIVCMVSARSAAMAFNRYIDARLDAANPRTAMRAIPAGQLSKSFVLAFTIVSSCIFLGAAAMLNKLTLELAPIALAVVLLYSLMKRITRWSHLVLGLALGIAPSAAWVAVRGTLSPRILLLTAIVILWVGGFDVLYACQDFEHDRKVGLRSIPAAFGLNGAFWIARIMHLGMLALLFVLVHVFALGWIALAGMALVAALLAYEHSIIRPHDLHRMNAAFFTLNGIISVVFFVFVAADILHRH
jgi:4-hydroxybenzoate polyprenyltransferase